MNKPPLLSSNFAFLQEHDEQLLRLGMLAERYFPDDPNTSIIKLRQLAELLAQLVATKVGLYQSPEESQYDLLRRLQDQGMLPREIAQLFGEVRRAGNAASHAMAGDHRTALAALKITWQLGLWFHRTFKNPSFKSGPFIPPQAPPDESAELRAELTRLSQALEQDRAAHQETAQRLDAAEARLREAKDEQTFWEQMASEAEAAKVALQQRLAAQQAETAAQPREAVTCVRRRGEHRSSGGTPRRGRDAQADRSATPAGWLDRGLRDPGLRARRSPREKQKPRHCRMAHAQRTGRLRAVRRPDTHRSGGSQTSERGCIGSTATSQAVQPWVYALA